MLEYEAVRTWLDGLRQHWGGDPANDDPERLPMLEAFCRFANRDPDQIIQETTMTKDGEMCWTDAKIEPGASGETVNDKGEKLAITRIAYVAKTM